MVKRFKKVAVLMGGPSSEREISLRSGAAVSRGLRAAGYEVVDVTVDGADVSLPAGVGAAFIALHGEFGEDGGVQRVLREQGVPYVGSDPDASRQSFDKRLSKRIFVDADIPTPEYEVLRRGDVPTLPLPVVVKPPRQGSTIGISRVADPVEWPAALEEAFRYDDEAIVERFIEGRELTVGIVGETVLPVVEIVAPGGWYGYVAKYTIGATEYRVPAPLSTAVTRACQDLAWRVFQALGCRGFGRVDFRLTPGGAPYVLEMNTIPGFTETSLLPKAARAAGIEFPDLCDRIMNLAAL